jgi:hypothetical protein
MTRENTLGEHIVAAFGRSLSGEVIRPGHPGYDHARRVWNGMIDRRPALIVRPRTATDVRQSVTFASDHGLELAVRGGGHNVAGTSTCDGGLVIDLSAMTTVHVDPESRTARVEGGATWGDFDRAAGRAGLATTGGMISSTGVAGLTLGGGVGWLMRAHGMACDNLTHATVVTAHDGIITTSPAVYPDLFAALCGGGGNFGVVTELGYRLHPVRSVLGGYFLHAIDRAADVLRYYDQYCRDAPDAITTVAALITAPAIPPVPEQLWNRPAVLIALCAIGDTVRSQRIAAPLRHHAPPAVDLVQPMPYPRLQGLLDATAPPGLRNYWKPGYTDNLPQLIDALTERIAAAPSPLTQILIHQMGGAVARPTSAQTTVSHRHARYLINVAAMWEFPSADGRNIAWLRETWSLIKPGLTGAYLNYLSGCEPEDVHAAYDPAVRTVLAQAKARWDPGNLFHRNHNITPSAI